MADQNGSGRPPRSAAENANNPLGSSRQSATHEAQPTSSSNNNAAPSRQPSFHSLAPYDERNLRDADHSPQRSPVDTSCADVAAPAEAAPPLGLSDLSIPSMNNPISNTNRHAAHGQQTAQTAPISRLVGVEYAIPAPNTGHRRRKIGGRNSAKDHRSPRPDRSYAYHHQSDNQYDRQYTHSAHGHASNHATRRRTVRSANRRAAAAAPVASAALPETTTPSLRPVLAALWRALLLAIVSKSKSIIQYCTSVTGKTLARKWVRIILYLICGVVTIFAACIATAAYGFYQEAKELCTPPSNAYATHSPPLVEYFVHGRGNGHYARSVAIIEKLNDAGVDVRMFIGRATMWRAVHEAQISSSTRDGRQGYDEKVDGETKSDKSNKRRRGITTAISVTSITPAMDVFATISHILERVTGDCEVARQTGRYPALVVTDGDVPGMLRSFFGKIPSVGISHGQTFSVGVKPSFIKSNKRLNAAWEKQSSLNWRAAFLTNWQIGTSFASMETRRPTGVIARSPMRPEAIGMARERWRRRHIGTRKDVFSSSGDGRNASLSAVETTASLAIRTAHRFLTPEQRSKIDSLLLGGAKGRTAVTKNQSRRHRLVICYFRDKNGDVLQNALLRSGFDVLLFERGYHKGLMNIQGVEKFGHKWIISRDAKTDEEMADMELEDYWRKMLAGTDAKLLEDHEGQHNATVVSTTATSTVQGQEEDTTDAVPSDEPRIIRVTDMSLFIPLLSIADGVASSAGSQLISECIYSGTPILSLYRDNDDEQMLNIMIYRNLIANDKEKDPAGVGKVVHGISLEEFSEAFSFLTIDDAASQRQGHKGTGRSPSEADETLPKLLTKEQEFLLLRKPEARLAYNEFDQFVDTIIRSKVSSSYYDELAQGDDPRDAPGWHDPFQGMADTAPVILEILKEITGEQ